VRASVRADVSVGTRAGGACSRACSLTYPARNAHAPDFMRPLRLHHIFRHLIKGMIFGKKATERKKVCFDFIHKCYLKHFSF
jgi:hypothetical protein